MSRIIIRPQSRSNLFNINELWLYRELFYFISWRDVKVKYKQTMLGIAWVVLQPLLMMVIFTLFFSRTLSIPSDNMPYPVFCFSGLLFWNMFSSGLSSSGNSLVANASIIKKIYFPRLIIPVSAVIVAVFDFLVTVALFLFVLAIWSFKPHWSILLYLPLAFIITLFTTCGAGFFLSALNVKYRDFRYIIPFLLQILLFATPVIYPVSMIKTTWIKILLSLNPITAAIHVTRSGLTGTTPETFIVLAGMISCVIIMLTGVIVFRKLESIFADVA